MTEQEKKLALETAWARFQTRVADIRKRAVALLARVDSGVQTQKQREILARINKI